MTMRTDDEGERTANFSIDVEWTTCDNDSMARDGETMIVLYGIDLSSANAKELNHFRAIAEAHASDETMKNQWNFRLNDTESCMWNDDSWKRGIGSMTSMAARS